MDRRFRHLGLALALATAACGTQPAQPAAEARARHDGRLTAPERLGEGLWYMRQPQRIWSAVIGNVGIVEQSDGIVLIDSGGSIADGRDIVAEVAKLSPKPIKAVVITHWHNDHPLGVPGILERYPRARVIATAATARMMKDIMGKNVGVGRNDAALDKARLDTARDYVAELRASAADPKLSAGERQEFATEANWFAQRVKRQIGNYVALPTDTFTDRLVLDDAQAPIELLHLGAANTAGDLVAWLPRQRLVFAGDAVVAPSPYGFNASIGSWVPMLERVKALRFAALVPGHGAVQHDARYVDAMIWSMRDVEAQIRAAIAKGRTAEQAVAELKGDAHAAAFRANTPWARRWLDGYWMGPIADSVYRELKQGKVVEGS